MSAQERQMSRFTGGQLCRVTAEVLANIFSRYEQKGKNGRSEAGAAVLDEETMVESKRADGPGKATGNQGRV